MGAWLQKSPHHRVHLSFKRRCGINYVDLLWHRGGTWERYHLHCMCICGRAVSRWSWREGHAASASVYGEGRSTTWACSSWDWPRTAQRWRMAEYMCVTQHYKLESITFVCNRAPDITERTNGVFVLIGGRSDCRDQWRANPRHHTHTGYRAHPSRRHQGAAAAAAGPRPDSWPQ